MKIGPSVRAQPTQVSPTVERAAARLETLLPAVAVPADGFVSRSGRVGPNPGTGVTPSVIGKPPAVEPRQGGGRALPESLEPFREALNGIINQITPELRRDRDRLSEFVMDSVGALGITGKDLFTAISHVLPMRQVNSVGRDRIVA